MSETLVKNVMTIKSGKFPFSRKFDRQALSPLLVEMQVLFRTVVDLPILPSYLSALEDELVRRAIYGSAAIEGNPLDERSVGLILSTRAASEDVRERAEREIMNLKNAYELIDRSVKVQGASYLSEEFIRQAHAFITAGIDYANNEPGQYRNHKVLVGDKAHGGVYTPPKILDDVRTLMGGFVDWFNSDGVKEEDMAVQAALAHYHLACIHPFANGNGRTARIIEAAVLTAAGIRFAPKMLSNYYYRSLDDYFRAFTLTQKNKDRDVTPFVEYFLKGMVASFNEIKDRITVFIRVLVLKDHFRTLMDQKAITHRQYKLLKALLEKQSPVDLADLFRVDPLRRIYAEVSDKAALEDLVSLADKAILLKEEGGYRLNQGLLG